MGRLLGRVSVWTGGETYRDGSLAASCLAETVLQTGASQGAEEAERLQILG